MRIECSVVYTEIMSTLKGGLDSLASVDSMLSLERYMELSETRSATLPSDVRELIYYSYVKYEKLKSERREYDLEDVVHYVYDRLKIEGYRGVEFTHVSIDEVQDLSPSQLSLFTFICRNKSGFVFAGDAAQTVSMRNCGIIKHLMTIIHML